MDIKVIIMDVDGTLTNDKKLITEKKLGQGSLYQAIGEDKEKFIKAANMIYKDPVFEELTKNDEITVVVQVNGKIRDKLQVANNTPKEELEKLALASPKIIANLEGKTPKKIIVVPNKLVSIVL